MTGTRKLTFAIALFGTALALVAVAAAVHAAEPLFAAWIPLLVVPWMLSRPLPGEVPMVARPGESPEDRSESPAEADEDDGPAT